jgi:hypothetical protein
VSAVDESGRHLVTTNTLRIVLVVISTCLSASSSAPTIRDTVRRRSHPRVVTWLTWALLTAVAGAASASSGDYPAAAFSFVGTLTTAAVAIAGLRYGDRSIGWLDIVCLALVSAGLVLWHVFNHAGIAVVAACIIDSIGLVPTVVHAWQRPREETPSTYALIAVAGACATLAAWGTWTVTAVAYPLYVLVSMGACWVIIITGHRPAPAEELSETNTNEEPVSPLPGVPERATATSDTSADDAPKVAALVAEPHDDGGDEPDAEDDAASADAVAAKGRPSNPAT